MLHVGGWYDDCLNGVLENFAVLSSRQSSAPGTDNYGLEILDSAINRLRITARSLHRLLNVARTTVDLESSQTISATHISVALLTLAPLQRLQCTASLLLVCTARPNHRSRR